MTGTLDHIADRLAEFRYAYWRAARGCVPRAALLVGWKLRDTIVATPHPPGSPWQCDFGGMVTVFGWPVWAVDETVGEPPLGPAGWQLVYIGDFPGGIRAGLPAGAST